MKRARLAAVAVAIVACLGLASTASGSADRDLSRVRQAIRHHSHVLRFFENHRWLLYRGPLVRRHVAWHAVHLAERSKRRLEDVLARMVAARAAPLGDRDAWLCIHDGQRHGPYVGNGIGEGSWTANTGNGYYGGLQMDLEFQRTYGPALLARKGTADRWTPREQIAVAEKARRSGRGYFPWPNTARYCGLI